MIGATQAAQNYKPPVTNTSVAPVATTPVDTSNNGTKNPGNTNNSNKLTSAQYGAFARYIKARHDGSNALWTEINKILKNNGINLTTTQLLSSETISTALARSADAAYKAYNAVKARFASASFDTGGYTGSWGPSGKLAMLHEKELVLNKQDTSNMLKAMDIVREITKTIDLNALYASNSNIKAMGLGIGSGNQALEQNVTITANFPNATDRHEIESAFDNIINLASQYANRKKL